MHTPLEPDRKIRIALTVIVSILISIGIVMIFSASAIFADQRYGDSGYFLKKHMMFLLFGGIGAVSAMLMDYRKLQNWALPVLVLSVLSLFAVLFIADPVGGARRWLQVGGFNIQPSEFAKVALVIYFSSFISKRDKPLSNIKTDLLPLIAVMGFVCVLILAGKDFGTTVVLSSVCMILIFAGGVSLRYFGYLIACGVPLITIAVLIEPYRMKRIVSFLNPWDDIQNAGFQLYQSLLAIGSGGFFGVGLGESQQKLFYLPEAHTDFIYAIIGEETGFLGAGLIILLFSGFAVVGWMIVTRARNAFGQFLALGLTSLIILEALINIGVSIGALPTKGLALPFISYGGSSLVVKMITVGLLLNIARDRAEEGNLD